MKARTSYAMARMRACLSQGEAAERAGIDFRALSRIETGRTAPRADLLLRLANLYGCTLDELCGRINGGDDATGRGKPGA